MNIGIVGATGMVGGVFLELLKERNFPVTSIKPFGSAKSLGKEINYNNKNWPLEVLKEGCFDGLDLVFFSSGDDISLEWGPKAAKAGALVVDNSAAFRMDPNTPLIVPEININEIPKSENPGVIANPNCSTIQLVVALNPLLKSFGLQRVHVASYQSVSGGGKEAQQELMNQLQKILNNETADENKCFPHNIAKNCIPQIGSFDANGFCTEELKIINETRKILNQPDLLVSAFTVRVPTLNGHGEAVWVTLNKEVSKQEITECFQNAEGIEILDNPEKSEYPLVEQATGQNPVYVGRIHQDLLDKKTWIFWVVADNIRKGAALNSIQIAEKYFK